MECSDYYAKTIPLLFSTLIASPTLLPSLSATSKSSPPPPSLFLSRRSLLLSFPFLPPSLPSSPTKSLLAFSASHHRQWRGEERRGKGGKGREGGSLARERERERETPAAQITSIARVAELVELEERAEEGSRRFNRRDNLRS